MNTRCVFDGVVYRKGDDMKRLDFEFIEGQPTWVIGWRKEGGHHNTLALPDAIERGWLVKVADVHKLTIHVWGWGDCMRLKCEACDEDLEVRYEMDLDELVALQEWHQAMQEL